MPQPRPYRFHAFDVSYFSAKVRPALRFKRVWYEEVRADLGEIARRTGLGFIPILVTPEDETWQDSSEIYDRLEARHPDPPLFPASPVQRVAAHLVELYTDEFATIPAMHYRWGSELGEATARARFQAMLGHRELGEAAAGRMARARLALGATDATAPAIEDHTRDLLGALSEHFESHPHLLGGRMSFADCALMGPVYGHFFNDLVSRRMLLEEAVPVVGWIERCQHPDPEPGEWLAGDELAGSFRRVLSVMGRDAGPVILAGIRAFESWADERPADLEKPPRSVGRVETALRGIPMTRFVGAYALWMLQRTLDAYRGLDPQDRARVDQAMAGTGWEPLLAHVPRHRLGKRDFELVFGSADPSGSLDPTTRSPSAIAGRRTP
ncbi:MAG: glutathione S-transferase family protein [Myxococcota bacterium]